MCGSHSQCSYQGLCHFDMYTACRGIVLVKGSPFLFGSPYASMHRTDLHIKKEILYRTITETKCVFILRLQLPWNCACNLDYEKKELLIWQILLQQLNELFFKLLLVSTKWQPCACVRACVRRVCVCVNECVWSAADLIHENVMRLSVLWGVSVCVSARTVCNDSIKSTAITNRISWVDSRSLSLLIDFLWFPSGHQGRTFCEWPRRDPLLWLNISAGLQSRHPSFRVRESQISQSYQRQQMLSSLLPGEKYSLSTPQVKDSRINVINGWIRWRRWVTATTSLGLCSHGFVKFKCKIFGVSASPVARSFQVVLASRFITDTRLMSLLRGWIIDFRFTSGV